jgi:hypothetical protein
MTPIRHDGRWTMSVDGLMASLALQAVAATKG